MSDKFTTESYENRPKIESWSLRVFSNCDFALQVGWVPVKIRLYHTLRQPTAYQNYYINALLPGRNHCRGKKTNNPPMPSSAGTNVPMLSIFCPQVYDDVDLKRGSVCVCVCRVLYSSASDRFKMRELGSLKELS